jgi:hypothetical protein
VAITVYVGPSIPDLRADAAASEGLQILPPIRSGDLFKLNPGPGDVVGIVDGLFHQSRAVTHKEILWAMGQGSTVLGAASMGALRAAELHPFGMIGIGGIFEDFARGTLVADDEVAVLHGDAETAYRSTGFALVDLRASVAKAVRERALPADQGEQVIDALARAYYPQRTWDGLRVVLLEVAGSPDAAADALAYLRENWVQLKRSDAVKLLDAVRGCPTGRCDVDEQAFGTGFLRSLELRSATTEDGILRSTLMQICQLFAADYPQFQRHLIQRIAAQKVERAADPAEFGYADGLLEQARRLGLPSKVEPVGMAAWLLTAEKASLDGQEALRTALARSLQQTAGPLLAREAEHLLQIPQLAERLVEIWQCAEACNDDAAATRPWFTHWLVPWSKVVDLLRERLVVDAADLEVAAVMRGFSSVDAMVDATRPLYLLWKFNPAFAQLHLRDFMTLP